MKRIGRVYLNADDFVDEANQTIGAPGLSPEIFINRRLVTGRLTDKGRLHLDMVSKFFKEACGLDVKFKWNRKCGCSMCPCSPGFDVRADAFTYGHHFHEDRLTDIWFNSDGTMKIDEGVGLRSLTAA